MNHPASYVIRKWLIDGQYAAWQDGAVVDWACYQGHMPDAPDNAVAVYDTMGNRDGRLMTGRTILHPGIQVKVRGSDYLTAFRKLEAMRIGLQRIKRHVVVMDNGDEFIIGNVSPAGDIMPLGQEHGEGVASTKRRWLFTLNCLCTFYSTLDIDSIDTLEEATQHLHDFVNLTLPSTPTFQT